MQEINVNVEEERQSLRGSLSKDEREALMSKPMLNTRRESDRELGVMLPETRTLLNNFYRPYNVKLAKLLGDNRFLWNGA